VTGRHRFELGSGLDARPYRLKLPEALRWIEGRFSRNRRLEERETDRSSAHLPARAYRHGSIGPLVPPRIVRRYGTASKRILVITEGVISYLSVYDASMLAADLHAEPSMHRWIQDFDNAGKRALPRGWAKRLHSLQFCSK